MKLGNFLFLLFKKNSFILTKNPQLILKINNLKIQLNILLFKSMNVFIIFCI